MKTSLGLLAPRRLSPSGIASMLAIHDIGSQYHLPSSNNVLLLALPETRQWHDPQLYWAFDHAPVVLRLHDHEPLGFWELPSPESVREMLRCKVKLPKLGLISCRARDLVPDASCPTVGSEGASLVWSGLWHGRDEMNAWMWKDYLKRRGGKS